MNHSHLEISPAQQVLQLLLCLPGGTLGMLRSTEKYLGVNYRENLFLRPTPNAPQATPMVVQTLLKTHLFGDHGALLVTF